MKACFQESVSIVRLNLIFIIIIACFGIHVPSETRGLFFPVLYPILSFIITTIAYGRLIGIVTGKQNAPLIDILKTHWLNFLLARLIVIIPAILFVSLLGRTYLLIAGWAVIEILTIYVWPLVFLKRNSLIAIRSGVKFLICNFKYSLPLVLLVLLSVLTGKILGSVIPSQGFSFAILRFTYHGLFWFIEFTIFTTAGMVLVKESNLLKRAGETNLTRKEIINEKVNPGQNEER